MSTMRVMLVVILALAVTRSMGFQSISTSMLEEFAQAQDKSCSGLDATSQKLLDEHHDDMMHAVDSSMGAMKPLLAELKAGVHTSIAARVQGLFSGIKKFFSDLWKVLKTIGKVIGKVATYVGKAVVCNIKATLSLPKFIYKTIKNKCRWETLPKPFSNMGYLFKRAKSSGMGFLPGTVLCKIFTIFAKLPHLQCKPWVDIRKAMKAMTKPFTSTISLIFRLLRKVKATPHKASLLETEGLAHFDMISANPEDKDLQAKSFSFLDMSEAVSDQEAVPTVATEAEKTLQRYSLSVREEDKSRSQSNEKEWVKSCAPKGLATVRYLAAICDMIIDIVEALPQAQGSPEDAVKGGGAVAPSASEAWAWAIQIIAAVVKGITEITHDWCQHADVARAIDWQNHAYEIHKRASTKLYSAVDTSKNMVATAGQIQAKYNAIVQKYEDKIRTKLGEVKTCLESKQGEWVSANWSDPAFTTSSS